MLRLFLMIFFVILPLLGKNFNDDSTKINILKENILTRPYNPEVQKVFIKNKNLFKKDDYLSLLDYALSNTRNKKAKEKLLKELKKYKRKDLNYETLIYYQADKNHTKFNENLNKVSLETQNGKELYYQLLYFLSIGDLDKVERVIKGINKDILKASILKNKLYIERQKSKHLPYKISENIIYNGQISTIISFFYALKNDYHNYIYFHNLAKTSGYGFNDYFYFYQMYQDNLFLGRYKKAPEYLNYICENDNYKGCNEELFNLYLYTANLAYKNKDYKESWNMSKNGILIGINLNYDKFYKKVLLLKRILRNSSLFYIKSLLQSYNRDTAKVVADETNKFLALTPSSLQKTSNKK